jgi:hypothetical protein
MEVLDINPHTYGYMLFFFFIKKPEIHTRQMTASSTNGAGQIGQLHVEEFK